MNKMNSWCQEHNQLLLIIIPQRYPNFSNHHHCYISLPSPCIQYSNGVPPHSHFKHLQLIPKNKKKKHAISTTCFSTKQKIEEKNTNSFAYSLGINSSIFFFFSTSIFSASLLKASKFLFKGFSCFSSSILSFFSKRILKVSAAMPRA